MDIDHRQQENSDEEFLATLSSQASSSSSTSAVQDAIAQFGQLSGRKLWHQLTVSLMAFLRMPQDTGHLQVSLWDGFIEKYRKRMDQLRVVEMATMVSQQYEDPQAALAFLKSVQASVDTPTTIPAHLLASTESAHFSLLQGDLSTVSSILSSCSKTLDTLDDVPPVVHASFYRVSGDYHKSKAEYAAYYKNSLLYLACVQDLQKDLSKEERISRAHDLGIAALLGESIYNFGELLLHPILEELKGTQWEWLHSLLYAFNAGSLGKFESLAPYLEQEPILASSLDFLRPKICLMSLIQLLFILPSSSRVSVPFSQIAQSIQLPIEEVEHLIMKALSLELVRGDIDQVEQKARITWVQPRVLGMKEIEELRDRLMDWSTKVKDVGEKSTKGNEVLLVQ